VDTHFGAISHGPISPLREYLAAQEIQNQAAASPAKVIVFPESVVPRWTTSTDLFWKPAIDRLRRDGKVVLIGAIMPESLSVQAAEWRAAADLLRSAHVSWPAPQPEEPYYYRNVAIIRGAESGMFMQRVPVPLSVWKPLSRGGAPLHMAGPSVMDIAGQRTAILICYEQVIPWTVLTAALARPHFCWGCPTIIGRLARQSRSGRCSVCGPGAACFTCPTYWQPTLERTST